MTCTFRRCSNRKWGFDVAKKSSGRQGKNSKTYSIKKSDVPVEDVVEDAEIVTSETVETVAEDVAEPVTEPEENPTEPVPEPIEDVAPEVEEAATPEPEVEEEKPAEPEPYEEPAPTPAVVEQRSNSFVPLVLGGAVAGIIGYGIATLQGGEDTTAFEQLIATQADEISQLQSEISDLAARPDPSEVIVLAAENQDAVTALGGRIDETITGLEDRVAVIERQPSADGTLQETAIAAYEQDIAELRDQIAAQQDELRGLLDETRQEAQSIEENAITSARNAMARASLAIVQGALETGSPMGAALTDLGDTSPEPVPDALLAVADGVATLATLQAEFPEAARAALATARAEGASGEDDGGFSSFLRNQFDVRSVEPQEGDSADAVLSRAEAALREGRLNDTLAELASLPEVARADLTDWTAMAEKRAAAIDAAAALASQLNVN